MSEELTTNCEVTETATPRHARPAYRTSGSEDGVEVEVVLPGVAREDLEVSNRENHLTIRGRRSEQRPEGAEVLQEADFPDVYELQVRLHPTLDPLKTSAEFTDGILRLRVPKREDALPRTIAVN